MTELGYLQETVDAFGADVSRWPDGRAAALRDVMETRDGRSVLAGDLAFASVLERAPGGSDTDTDDLMARIMEQVDDSIAPVSRRADVKRGHLREALVGGLLAASLLLGLFAGVTGIGTGALPDALVVAHGEAPVEDSLVGDLTFGSDLEDDVL